ncbi:MAG: hypothetical protein ACJAXS_001065 [Colwellia sp.]|jgi:hypothetical protein
MTLKNNTRKFNITTKVNKDEFSLLLNAFHDSNYKTAGHFYRDTILSAVSPQENTSFDVPEINLEYAQKLQQTLQNFNHLIGHLNLSLVDDKHKLSTDLRDEYIKNSIDLVQATASQSIIWFEFFGGKYRNVIETIALNTLSPDTLEEMAFTLRKKEGENDY